MRVSRDESHFLGQPTNRPTDPFYHTHSLWQCNVQPGAVKPQRGARWTDGRTDWMMTCRVSTLCVWELNPSRRTTIFCNTLRKEISHTHKQHLQGWGGNLNFQQSYRADLSWRARSPKKPAAPRRRPPQSQKWSNSTWEGGSCAITRRTRTGYWAILFIVVMTD